MRIVSICLMILGVLGLAVTFLGEITALGDYKSSPPRSWEKFDPQLVLETPSLVLLQNKIDSLINQPINQSTTEQEKMLMIYKVVIQRFTHSDQAEYNVFSDWPLWLMGRLYMPFSYIRNPAVLVEKGHSSLCREQAYLLQTLAESVGIRTRAVGLSGHVVMEAWYEDDWHLYDPDLEVVPQVENNHVLSLDELAKSPELIHKFYAGRGDNAYVQHIVDVIASREDNSFLLYWMIEKHLAYRFEKMTNVIKWVFPVIFLAIGFGLYFKSSRKD